MSAPDSSESLHVHDVEWASRANGPGTRAVVWVQGCTLACVGCFNPGTHAAGGALRRVEQLADDLVDRAQDGVTLTGGEPFQQWAATTALLRLLRRRRPDLSLLVFTGYTLGELRAQHPDADDRLAPVDVLVAGRYVARRPLFDAPMLGSANQQVHLLTSRHRPEEIAAVPLAEVLIDPRGGVTVTGVAPPVLAPAAVPGRTA